MEQRARPLQLRLLPLARVCTHYGHPLCRFRPRLAPTQRCSVRPRIISIPYVAPSTEARAAEGSASTSDDRIAQTEACQPPISRYAYVI